MAGDDAIDPPSPSCWLPLHCQLSLVLDEAGDILVGGGGQVDGIFFQPDTHTGRAGLGHQPQSSTKGRHWVEGVQGETSFLPLTGDDVSARGHGADEDVLKVVNIRQFE